MATYDRDPTNEVIVRWHNDGDGTGKLFVAAAANGFSGKSAAWFSAREVSSFAASIAGYPLDDTAPPLLVSGFGADADDLEQVHVRISVAPVGRLGQVGFRVCLATEVWPDDRPEAQHEVRLELLTTYQRVARFGNDLSATIEGRLAEAIVGGETLA